MFNNDRKQISLTGRKSYVYSEQDVHLYVKLNKTW